MAKSISRSDFLQGNFRGKVRPVRPPWALTETDFTELCNQCGDCIGRCPTGIISAGRGRYPLINFRHGECLFCGDCVSICKTGALTRTNRDSPWLLSAVVDEDRCLAFKSVECRSCIDPCESRAIEMIHRLGAVAVPVIDATRCSGCGACYAPCPVNAIEIRNLTEQAA